MIGLTLSHYRILAPLGAGGMGIVYLAEDQRLGRQVALKCLPQDAVKDHYALDRFRLEARTASSLNHPGICTIYDIGVYDDAPYIVMELLKGETLRERVVRGPFKIIDVLDMGIQLADALGAAHAQGIVHRDIKPANIFVGEKLRVKILDFGLAKLAGDHAGLGTGARNGVTAATVGPLMDNQLTAPGTAIGTVSYMSPEQARGEDVDGRTDIFSLGVVLYEMVTGRQAFGGSTSAVVFDHILNRAPVSPGLLNPETPQRLVDVINTALEKDRDMRYERSSELEADLKRIRRDLQSGATVTARRTAVTVAAPAAAMPTATAASVPNTAEASAAAAPSSGSAAHAAGPGSLPWWLFGAVSAVALGGLAIWSVNRPPEASPTQATAVDQGSGNRGASEELRRAQLRLDARDFRAALVEATAALRHDPGNADAARLRSIAERELARLEGMLDTARQALTKGDALAATRALAEAQAHAPADAEAAALMARARAIVSASGAGTAAANSGSRPAVAAPPPEVRRGDAPSTAPAAAAPAEPAEAVPQPPPPSPGAAAKAVEPVAPPAIDPPPSEARPTPRPDPPPTAPPPPPAPADADNDEAAVRRAIETYERAIESKDLALFRAVRPDLSADEERRLRASFNQVGKQQIDIRVESLSIEGDTAVARLARRDVIQTGGRTQTSQTQQAVRLVRRGAGWVIVELGR